MSESEANPGEFLCKTITAFEFLDIYSLLCYNVHSLNMNLKQLILEGESETLEFKLSTGEWKEIIKTISAFANTRGGKIIIGVSESGGFLGIEIGKDTIEQLTNKISQNTDPKVHPRITVQKLDNKSLIVVEAKESSDHLVLSFGKPYKRVGKSTLRISKDEYERLILEKHKEDLRFDSQICTEAGLKDINREKSANILKISFYK